MDTTETTDSTLGEVEPTKQMWRGVIAQLRRACAGRIADPGRVDDVVGDLLVRIQQNLTRSRTGSGCCTGCSGSSRCPSPTRTRRLCSVSSRHAPSR